MWGKTYPEVECASFFATYSEKITGNEHLNPQIYNFISLFWNCNGTLTSVYFSSIEIYLQKWFLYIVFRTLE